jgi:hypothetical protein
VKFLTTLCVAAALGYAGVKYYLHVQTRDALAQLATALAPVASLQYRAISSTLWPGTLRVDGVQLTPHGVDDSVVVRALEFSADGIGSFLMLPRRLAQGKSVDALRLHAEGVSLGLDGPLLRAWDQRAEQINAEAAAKKTAAHCGGIAAFGPKHYRQLGYRALEFDVTLQLRFDRYAGSGRVYFDLIARDLGSLSVETTVKALAPALSRLDELEPRVTELSLIYRDHSYIERVTQFCSEVAKITVAEYIEAEAGKPDRAFERQWGLVPGPGWRAAYRRFLQQPTDFRLHARPTVAIDAMTLVHYKADNVLAMLNLTASVNGEAVEDLRFAFEPRPLAVAKDETRPASRPAPKKREAGATRRVKVEEDTGPQYRSIRVDDLPKYVGMRVRLDVVNAIPREGILAQVQNDVVLLERNVAPTNNVTIRIPLNHVTGAEVQTK